MCLGGSEVNDLFITSEDGVKTKSNHSGGIQGGIFTERPFISKWLSSLLLPLCVIRFPNDKGEEVLLKVKVVTILV